jgi:glucose-1-phosphate adenylyltransferase
LGVLTGKIAKPAVPYGGKYRIIDFPLSNCANSGIDTVGILTQYKPLELNDYVASGKPWDLDRSFGGVHILPPYHTGAGGDWYKGTANAIYQNIEFLARYNPEYVLILSGDHIYKMDYAEMIEAHKKNNADCTIAVFDVPLSEASRFGIMTTDENLRITEFAEKPKEPKSTKASMGVYVFSMARLVRLLHEDHARDSTHDFGKDILPKMVDDYRVYAYDFADNRVPGIQEYEERAYWRDVGTLTALAAAQQDATGVRPRFNLWNPRWPLHGRTQELEEETELTPAWRGGRTDLHTDERVQTS